MVIFICVHVNYITTLDCCGKDFATHTFVVHTLFLSFIAVVLSVFLFAFTTIQQTHIPGHVESILQQLPIDWNLRNHYLHWWYEMQARIRCCGLDKPSDWGTGTLPSSCCYYMEPGRKCTLISKRLNKRGCIFALCDAAVSFGGYITQIPKAISLIGFASTSWYLIWYAMRRWCPGGCRACLRKKKISVELIDQI